MPRSCTSKAAEPTAAPARGDAAGGGSVARADLRWVVVATLLSYLLASAANLDERLAALALPLEAWQVDELPLSLTTFGLGLAWYGWRRCREAARLLAHNRVLAQELITVQERERVLLARELHDELAQHCTAIRIEAAILQRAADTRSTRAAAGRAAASAGHLMDGVRGILRRLRPAELDELGLAAALQSQALSWQARTGLHCAVEVGGLPLSGLDPSIEMALYRITQEALSNVQRHARARHAAVRLQRNADALTLQITDDGCGFDPPAQTRGLGLLGAAERAAALSGRLLVDSRPGGGTRVCVTLPVPKAGIRDAGR